MSVRQVSVPLRGLTRSIERFTNLARNAKKKCEEEVGRTVYVEEIILKAARLWREEYVGHEERIKALQPLKHLKGEKGPFESARFHLQLLASEKDREGFLAELEMLKKDLTLKSLLLVSPVEKGEFVLEALIFLLELQQFGKGEHKHERGEEDHNKSRCESGTNFRLKRIVNSSHSDGKISSSKEESNECKSKSERKVKRGGSTPKRRLSAPPPQRQPGDVWDRLRMAAAAAEDCKDCDPWVPVHQEAIRRKFCSVGRMCQPVA